MALHPTDFLQSHLGVSPAEFVEDSDKYISFRDKFVREPYKVRNESITNLTPIPDKSFKSMDDSEEFQKQQKKKRVGNISKELSPPIPAALAKQAKVKLVNSFSPLV